MAARAISSVGLLCGCLACGSARPNLRTPAEVSALYADMQVQEERLAQALATLREVGPSVYQADPRAELSDAVQAICALSEQIREQDANERCLMARRQARGAPQAKTHDDNALDPQG